MKLTEQPSVADALRAAGAPERVVRVLRLFAEELSEVEFPGTSRRTLELCATAMLQGSARVAEARAALIAAEHELAEHAAGLERATERGLAYARVYAEEDVQLREALHAWGEASRLDAGAAENGALGAAPSARRRRGRRRAEASEPASAEQLDLASDPSPPGLASERASP